MRFLQNLRMYIGVALVLCSFSTISAGRGVDFMNDIINQFQEMRKELVEDFSDKNRAVIAEKAKKLALEIIDIAEISRLALGSYGKKVSLAQRKEFAALFHDLMAGRVVAAQLPKKKILPKKIPIRIRKEVRKKDRKFKKDAIIVLTHVPHKRVVYDVDFYLFETNGKIKMYDIHLDGNSTLNDFRNQFARIIRKSGKKRVRRGMNVLLKKLRKKINQLNKIKK